MVTISVIVMKPQLPVLQTAAADQVPARLINTTTTLLATLAATAPVPMVATSTARAVPLAAGRAAQQAGVVIMSVILPRLLIPVLQTAVALVAVIV